MTHASTETLLSDLLTYIDKAEQLLASGQMAELAGLNDAVDALCQGVVALAPEEAKEYAPELDHLNERLSDLQKAMTAAQTSIEASLESLDKRQRATKAYLTTPEG